MTVIARLEAWYRAQCNGDWEHAHGVSIGTLDNPGWSVKIDLAGTTLEHRPFSELNSLSPGAGPWLSCRKNGAVFEGFGSPDCLGVILDTFLTWAEASVPSMGSDGFRAL